MRRGRFAAAVVPVATLALALTACGSSGSSGGGGNGGNGGTSNGSTAAFNAALNGIRSPSTARGGTLNITTTSDCDYWDPARTYYAYCWNLQRLLSRGLMAYRAAPGQAGTQVIPDLATAPGQTTDAKTWTYHIRPGLKFSNGDPITTKNIKYAIERVFATSVINGGPTYVVTFLCPTKLDSSGACTSYKGPYSGKSSVQGLSTIDTPNDTTIVFHLNQKFSDWNYIMATPISTPIDIAYDQGPNGGAKYTFHPVTDGPYKFASYSPGKKVVFVRNPYWQQSTDPFRKALPDQIIYTVNSNAVSVDNNILAGTEDLDVGSTGVQVQTQANVLQNAELKKYADDPYTGFTRYLALNTKVAPFNNINCRLAVQYAVNKTDWQTARGGPIGGGAIASTMLPPNVPGYHQFDFYPNGPNNTGDLAKAKQYLAKCGHPNGFSTHIATTNSGKGPSTAQAVQAALKRVGITTTIDERDSSSYYSQFIGAPSSVHQNDLGIMVAGWGADFPTGYGFFSQIVDGRQIKAQGNSNYEELNDPKVNSLIDQATATTDRAQATSLWGQVDEQVMKDAVEVPMTYDKALFVISKRLRNAYITNAFGMYDFQALGVK